MAITGMEDSSKEETKAAAEKNLNIIQRLVKTLADIFIPIIPAIVTAGLLMGINNLLTAPDIFFTGQSVIDVYPQWQISLILFI